MKLHSTTRGAGPEHIAFVHGLGGDGATWDDLVAFALDTGRYTITTVDLRGHGLSHRASSYTVREFADDLVESLPTNLDCIVSHSLGGTVVLAAAERLAPRHAVYFDPGFQLRLPSTGFGGWLLKTAPFTLPLFLLTAGRGVRKPNPSPSGKALEDAAQQRWDRKMAVVVFRDVWRTAQHPEKTTIPSTLVLSEDAPYVVPDEVVTRLTAAGWEVRRIPDLGHSLFLEDAAAVWDAVSDVV